MNRQIHRSIHGVSLLWICVTLFASAFLVQGLLSSKSRAQETTDTDVSGVTSVNSGYSNGGQVTNSSFSSLTTDDLVLAQILAQEGGFTNISQILLDGVAISMDGNNVVMSNLRIASDTTTLNDLLRVTLSLSASDLRLIPTKVEVIANVGLYNEQNLLFSKDVATAPTLTTPSGTVLGADQSHTLTINSTSVFSITAESGTVLSVKLDDPTDNIEYQFNNPDGSVRISTLFLQNSNWFLGGVPILESGVYTIRIIPQSKPTATVKLGFTNNNRKTLTSISSGSAISASLGGWGTEFAKYRIDLQRGDIISISAPSDRDIQTLLFRSDGSGITGRLGGILTQKIDISGTYFIFIRNQDLTSGTSYNGTVSVSLDPNRDKYPTLSDISNRSIILGQPFALQISATNNPTKYVVSGLPPGLSFNPSSGLISGQAQAVGLFPIKVTTTNTFGGDRRDFLLRISAPGTTNSTPLFLPIIRK